MTKPKILQEGASYTFRSYFELPNDTDEVLAEFGYRFERQRLQLPKTTREIDRLFELQQQLSVDVVNSQIRCRYLTH
jgi:hypothetical protein